MQQDSLRGGALARIRAAELVKKLKERSNPSVSALSVPEIDELLSLLATLAGSTTHDVSALPAGPDSRTEGPLGGIESPSMERIDRLIGKAASCELPVLIVGESGTGKEIVAREIHRRGFRASKPFFSENCAALTETLLESELFGHVRGSFTGAERDRKGILELAHHGTLFLDELGDMSLAMQSKLLRVLQEGEVRPVGSRTTTRIDVRFISATNRDLQRLVEQGLFRLDLFYRINVITIALPPLRDRREDIPHLIEHFIHRYTRRTGCTRRHFNERALDLLCAYEWPGNIRELENTVYRCLVLSEEAHIEPGDLPDRIRRLEGFFEGRSRVYQPKTGEQILIERALRDSLGDKAKAARYIGWSRPKLYRKIREYGISFDCGKPAESTPPGPDEV